MLIIMVHIQYMCQNSSTIPVQFSMDKELYHMQYQNQFDSREQFLCKLIWILSGGQFGGSASWGKLQSFTGKSKEYTFISKLNLPLSMMITVKAQNLQISNLKTKEETSC